MSVLRRLAGVSAPLRRLSTKPPTPEALDLAHLGRQTAAPTSPDEDTLERVPNQHADTLYMARFVCPEFTSICPVTSQPDFAHLVIDYVPRDWLVESKSLKLYLTSYRSHGDFHEACTVGIGKAIVNEIDPVWLRIVGMFPIGDARKLGILEWKES